MFSTLKMAFCLNHRSLTHWCSCATFQLLPYLFIQTPEKPARFFYKDFDYGSPEQWGVWHICMRLKADPVVFTLQDCVYFVHVNSLNPTCLWYQAAFRSMFGEGRTGAICKNSDFMNKYQQIHEICGFLHSTRLVVGLVSF